MMIILKLSKVVGLNNVIKIAVYFILLFEFTAFSKDSIDYKDDSNWAIIDYSKDKNYDVFFVSPTVYIGTEFNRNMQLDDSITKSNFVGASKMEKGIYDEMCNFYSPYYRQAALINYSIGYENSEKYFMLAYNDISDAFDNFLKYRNQSRPFILAGFSQGSDMLLRLMKHKFQNRSLQSKHIASYLIGWRITDKDLIEHPYLKIAQSENDIGVIITFNCEAEYIDSSVIVPNKAVCINPLNWKTNNEMAEKELNLGAAFTNYSGKIIKEIPHFCGAYIDKKRGTLKITNVNSDDYPPFLNIFEPGVYHIYDYLFFFKNLQKNVEKRIINYKKNTKKD